MKLALVIVALASTSAVAGSTDVAYGLLSRHGLGLDLDLAVGARLRAGEGDATRSWFTRARVGLLAFDEPSFWSLGVAGQYGPLASSSLGIELGYAEVFHGATAQVGVFPLDTTGGTSVTAQLGWTVFGLEYQRRISGPRDGDQALVFVVQAPLGVIYQMLKDPPGGVHH